MVLGCHMGLNHRIYEENAPEFQSVIDLGQTATTQMLLVDVFK